MKRSTERILTTHTGSLPRPDDLVTLLYAKEKGELQDQAAFEARVRTATAEVVRKLNADLDSVLKQPELTPRWAELGITPLGGSPDAAVKRMTDALHGTRFARPYDTDVRQVEEETVNLLGMRSHNRSSFCETVERLLAASDGFDVDSCLTVLELGAEPWRILAAARRHARELVAFVEAERAWLFWYGCRAEALPNILKRMNLELTQANREVVIASKAMGQLNEELFFTLAKMIDARDPFDHPLGVFGPEKTGEARVIVLGVVRFVQDQQRRAPPYP